MSQYFLYGLCGIYVLYGLVFCSNLCIVVYKENKEERMKIQRQYETIDESYSNIRMSTVRDYNSRLETIVEEDPSCVV